MYKLIISIVPHNCGEIITKAAVKAGATGGTILMGRGTAKNNILQLLGLGETSKDIAYILTKTEQTLQIIEKIKEVTDSKRNHFGILFTVNVNTFIKSGETTFKKNPVSDTVAMAGSSEDQVTSLPSGVTTAVSWIS